MYIYLRKTCFTARLILFFLKKRLLIRNEGYSALFKGLMANLLGVAPYRAIYFFMYSNSKAYLLPLFKEDNSKLHICSAYIAGIY